MGDGARSLEDGFHAGVSELLAEIPRADEALGRMASEEAIEYGRSAARQALAPVIWRTLAGEVLSTEDVRKLLGVSRQALHKRLVKGTLLGLPGERVTFFPSWQFSRTGEVHPAVPEVLRTFRERLGGDVDAHIVLAWATAPQPELKGMMPAEWLEADHDSGPLVRSAERAAHALAQ